MKKITILIFSLVLISCSKDFLFNKNQIEISKELKEIRNADSGVRNFDSYVNFRYGIRDFDTVVDSLDEIGKYENIKTFDFSKIPRKEQQIEKWSNRKFNLYDESKQESEKMMDYIDKINSGKLYQIVKKYGFPSFYNRKWNDTINLRIGMTTVFTHYNYITKKESKLLKLIIKEYFAGRVNEGEMKQIMWSVEGRNGYPYNYTLDNKKLKEKLRML